MIIHWSGIRSDIEVLFSQPEKDVLRVNDDEFDFSDTGIVSYDIPETLAQYCVRAERVDETLHLHLAAFYGFAQKRLWEPIPSIETVRDYGAKETLSWHE